MKKLISVVLASSLLLTLAACSSGSSSSSTTAAATTTAAGGQATSDAAGSSSAGTTSAETTDIKGKTIEVAVNYTGQSLTTFEEVVDDFQNETGATVELAAYGDDYESTLKTRMASNELPDIFVTHGWSILRYKEYLQDLRNESWVSTYDPSALGVIQDTDGSIYVLMISELANGTLVNLDACEKAGVDPYSIYDWDDFTEACQKLKDAGITPIATTADNAGTMCNYAGTWLSYENETSNDSAAMLDGTYDWTSYQDTVLKYLSDWMDKGFYPDDVATVSDTDLQERFANNEIAFYLGNDPSWLISAKQLNADGNYAFLPSFASTTDGAQFVGIGEGDAFGIWKDSKETDAAKVFLNYLTRTEVCTKINNVTGKIGAITTATETDDSYGQQLFATMQSKYPNVFYENLWDRKYMPSGMWPIFGNAAQMLFEDHSADGQTAVKEYLSENYKDLYEAAQSD
ncbi:extracellular solute-binding protein [Oscillospiraceae bacterium HV4-5-C5C]|nr:extracellular solute-binding protein [Oscillospiraceae bacterium HV4-5-C5C]